MANRTKKHYVILYNPVSTRAAAAKRRIRELETLVGKKNITTVHTVKGGFAKNRALIEKCAQRFTKHTVLGILAGDGTINTVVNTLITSKDIPHDAQNVSILPLWGGNANDLAHMLNGPNPFSLKKVLLESRRIHVTPLSCLMQYPNGEIQERIAACYISFGATAHAAARMSRKAHRNNPLHKIPGFIRLSEAASSLQALQSAPLFHVSENGQQRYIYERTFTTGQRFAKHSVIPIQLTDQTFFMQTVPHKRILQSIRHIVDSLRLKRGIRSGPITFICDDPTRVQFDGEAMKLPANTTITISLAKRSFYALSTLLGDSMT